MLGDYVDYMTTETSVGFDTSLGIGIIALIFILAMLVPLFLVMCAIYFVRRTAYGKHCKKIRKEIKKQKAEEKKKADEEVKEHINWYTSSYGQ